MTHLIDLYYDQAQISCGRSFSSQNSFLYRQNAKTFCIHQVIKKFLQNINKINIKTVQQYIFQLDRTNLLINDTFCNYPVKILGIISLRNAIFSLRIQFFDQKGIKISAKSIHHRTVISNFVFQINAQLQNFKLQYNPFSGEFSFVFNVKAHFTQKCLISELIQFALNSYFQECQGHLYVLNLIEFLNQNQNIYLKNIQQDFIFLKRWIRQRQQENQCFIRKFIFYKKFLQFQKNEQEYQNQNFQQKSCHSQIKKIQKYLYPQSIRFNIFHDLCIFRVKQFYKKFKIYYKEQEIFPLYMANKVKYQNVLTIMAKNIKNLEEFLAGKSIIKQKDITYMKVQHQIQKAINQNNFNFYHKKSNKENEQNQSSDSKSQKSDKNQQKIRIWDKNTGKNYLIKLLHLKGHVRQQQNVLRILCRFDSYLFINQYFELQNYNLTQNDYLMVNAHPKRILLSEFLKKNDKIISFRSKITITIHLVQIIYTLHIKSKIQNYFPLISIKNLQISRNFSLSFKFLSSLTIHPLFELINTINFIFFDTPLNNLKRDNTIKKQLIKGDQIQDKNWGASMCIKFLKYYLYQLHGQALRMIILYEINQSSRNSLQTNQQIEQWKRTRFTKVCQQLLVILCHFLNIFSRGFQQKYNFEEQSDIEE